MICYFAQRDMTILMHASTGLSEGYHIQDDKKTESIEAGQDTFSGYLCYGDGKREEAETAVMVGNYILRKNGDTDEFYTIIDTESDPNNREVYFYAEAAGLDLIGEVCEAYEATSPMTLAQYMDVWLYDTGFEVGVDETDGATQALVFEDSDTAMERILSTAESFGMEVSYRFEIERLSITHKYIDFHAQRGSTVHEALRRGRDFESIHVKKSIANIATALRVTGGTPDGSGIRRNSDNTYTWVKYSEYSNGYDEEESASMQDDSDDMQYIGISYGHASDEESEVPSLYYWGMIRKASGIIAIPTNVGYRESADISGKARYTWVEFATDENGSNMSDNPADRSYIGLALHQTSQTKGALASQYTWYPMSGRDVFTTLSSAVSEGDGLYTWLKFADDKAGTNMSDSPVGKGFVGMAFHKSSSTASTDAGDYDWQEITLNTTTGGFVMFNPSYPGIQTDSTFLWYQFATDANGTDMSGVPNGRPYLGLAYNQTTAVMSTDPADYEWDLIDADTSSEVTLKGMTYDDGDFYVDSSGDLMSRVALARWSRYVSPDETGTDLGHIVGEFTCDATNQDDLLLKAIADLTKRREPETSYELDIIKMPDNLSVGDTVPIVDHEGKLYLTARLLKMETSEEKDTHTGTFGDYKVTSTTLSDMLAKLTAQQREAERYKYTWIVYADSATGDGIRTDPLNATYLGVSYNRSTQVPNLSDPFEYTWSLIGAGATNVLSVTWYYMLQDESSDPPTSPTEDTPTGWSTTEPDYTEGSTEVLYTVFKTTYVDGSFEYSEVSLSSSYTAAKTAYEEALEAKRVATNYVSADSTGMMVANMADGNTYTPSNVVDGIRNVFIDNDSVEIRNGSESLASYGETVRIGSEDSNHQEISEDGTTIYNANGVSLFDVDTTGGSESAKRRLTSPQRATLSADTTTATETVSLAGQSLTTGTTVTCYVNDRYKDGAAYVQTSFTITYGTSKTVSYSATSIDHTFVYSASDDTITHTATINDTALSNSYTPYYSWFLTVPATVSAPAYTLGTRRNTDKGGYSTACGKELSATSDYQFACGAYNVDNPEYLLMVGNGNGYLRNAFAVTDTGDLLIGYDSTSLLSDDDTALLDALRGIGWEEVEV